jgi:histidinol-phosphate/aromatic aminotransferase/cobyric acid decarboxylase-like protein
MMVRTFSKARGLAGLRVGYAVAPGPIITLLRTTGGPYPVSPISLTAAAAALDEHDRLAETVARVRTERTELTALLTQLGARPMPTQANFVTARFQRHGRRVSAKPCATPSPPAASPSEAGRPERTSPASSASPCPPTSLISTASPPP